MGLDNIRFAGMTKQEKKDWSVIYFDANQNVLLRLDDLTLSQASELRKIHGGYIVRTTEII